MMKTTNEEILESDFALNELEKAFEWLFRAFAYLTFFAVGFASLRIIEHGFSFFYPIQWLLAAVIIINTYLKHKIPFKKRLLIFWLVLILYGSTGLFAYGFLGQGTVLIIGGVILASVGGGKRSSIISITISFISIVSAGILITQRIIPLEINPESYAYSISAWITAITTIFCSLIFFCTFLIKFNTGWFSSVKKLKEFAQKNREIFNSTSDALIICDAESMKIIDINSPGLILLGYTYKQVLKKKIINFCIDEEEYSAALFNQKINQLINTGNIEFKWKLMKKDNTVFWVFISFKRSEILGKDRIIVTAHDISENIRAEEDKKNLEKQLVQSEKIYALGQLAGGIAHDFNNILGGIIGYAGILSKETEKNSLQNKHVKKILKASERASHLIYNILQFSGQSTMKKEPVYLKPVIDEIVSLIQAIIPSSIVIRSNIINETFPVLADTNQIHEMLLNLCINASHAMNNSGILQILLNEVQISKKLNCLNGTLYPGFYSLLSVKDTGSGIDKEIINKIFDLYFTTKGEKGSGIGLFTVLDIVKRHEGYITVESEVGKGTVFKIYFPKTENRVEESEISLKIEDLEGTKSILLLDDEKYLVELNKEYLQSLGYTVEGFTNPETALNVFSKKNKYYDLVISDLTMPEMNGIDFINKIRKIRRNIPAFICTGKTDMDTLKSIKLAGIDDVLGKPSKINDMAKKIKNLLKTDNF